MTTRGRYANDRRSGRQTKPAPGPEPRPRGKAQIHVIGTSEDVAQIISRIAHVVDIVHQTRQYPRRDDAGKVSVYLDVE